MNARVALLCLVGIAFAAVPVLSVCTHAKHELEKALPERIVCASEADAKANAGAGAVPVLGTGSMAPFIPAAPAGKDPLQTVVAFVVIDPARTFDTIKVGSLCSYRPAWAKGGCVLHQAVKKTGFGWVMAGLHNAHSESWEPITPEKFVGIVSRVYVWNTQ